MFTKFIIGITISAILLFVSFVLAVLFVKFLKRTSTEEALNTIYHFFQQLYDAFYPSSNITTDTVSYPVFIGYNGYDFKASNVERAFSHLDKYWNVVYFECIYNNHPNLLVYQFRVNDPLYSDMKKSRLMGLIQNVAEKALATHMHNFNCYISVSQFIAVRLQYDILQIAIAKNNAGFENIANLRKHR